MGNCGSSVDCKPCPGKDQCLTKITVNPDLAGIGVLLAFVLSAVLTCAAVFWGYVTDSLPSSVLSEADKIVIQRCQRSLPAKSFSWMWRRWMDIKNIPRRMSGKPLDNSSERLPREQRVEALTRFVLALSDQQLVTGIAIIAAAVANRCIITVFEFRIVSCLAWWSATTHLATLEILQEYMLQHPVVRNLRVIGIVVFVVLLGFVQMTILLIKFSTKDLRQISVLQCVFPPEISSASDTIVDQLFLVAVYVYILIRYISSVLKFYRTRRSRGIFHGNAILELLTYSLRIGTHNLSLAQWFYHLRQDMAAMTTRDLARRDFGPGPVYLDSFLPSLAQILFTLASGVSQTIFTVWFKKTEWIEMSGEWGFGQVTALILLALPVLAGAEIYNEARLSAQKKRVDHVVHRPNQANDQRENVLQAETGYISPTTESAQFRGNQTSHSCNPSSMNVIKLLNDEIHSKRPDKLVGKSTILLFVLDAILFLVAGVLYPITIRPLLFSITAGFCGTFLVTFRVVVKLWLVMKVSADIPEKLHANQTNSA